MKRMRKAPVQRRSEVHDPTGGAHSRPVHRKDDAHAFLPDPYDTDPMMFAKANPDDAASDLAEEMGEEFVTAATANLDVAEQELERVQEGEFGGPFTQSSANEEIANDEDANNPPGATREPFPSPMRAAVFPAVTIPRR